MADSGFDSGPPSKKSKTSSPTSSITSFDPETADLSRLLSEFNNELPAELGDPILPPRTMDGGRKLEDTLQNNRHLSALLGMDFPMPRGAVGVEMPRMPSNPSGLSGIDLNRPGGTVNWSVHPHLNTHPYVISLPNQTSTDSVPPQPDLPPPAEFVPGMSNFASGSGPHQFPKGLVRNPTYQNTRMVYNGPRPMMHMANMRMPHPSGTGFGAGGSGANILGLGSGSARGVGNVLGLGTCAGLLGGEKLSNEQMTNGAHSLPSGELPKAYCAGMAAAMSQSYTSSDARNGTICETSGVMAATDAVRPIMSRAPGRIPANSPLGKTIAMSLVTTSTTSSDAVPVNNSTEKQRLIQQQLVLIFHAHKCHRREQANGMHQPPCPLPQCQSMKNVLKHMVTCTDGRSCRVPHCASSRQIIAHWRNCPRPDCPICAPLKNGTLRRMMPSSGAPAPAAPTDANPMYEGFSPKHATAVHPPVMSSDASGSQLGLGSTASSAVSISAAYGGLKSIQSSLGEEDVAPVPGQDWRLSVTQDLRNHLVHKLVQAIFPTHEPTALRDPRMSNLVSYAKKVEGDMYEKARSREDYYHLLAEKIYKIQKELEQKKLRRIIDQNGIKVTTSRVAMSDILSSPPLGRSHIFPLSSPSSPPFVFTGDNTRSMPLLQGPHPSSSTSVLLDTNVSSPLLSRLTDTSGLQQNGNPFSVVPKGGMNQARTGASAPPYHPQDPHSSSAQHEDVAQNALISRLVDSKQQLTNVLSKRRQEMEMMEKFQLQSDPMSTASQAMTSVRQSVSSGVWGTSSASFTYSQAWDRTDKAGPNSRNDTTYLGCDQFFSPGSAVLVSGSESLNQLTGNHLSDDPFGFEPMSMPSLSSADIKVDIKHEDITDDEMAAKSESVENRDIIDATDTSFKMDTVDTNFEIKAEMKSDSYGFSKAQDIHIQSESLVKSEATVKSESEIKSELQLKTEALDDSEVKPDAETAESTGMSELKTESSDASHAGEAVDKVTCRTGKKTWTAQELEQAFMPLLNKLCSIEPEAAPFRTPVDPVALCIPDYFQIVKKPMDLSLILSKLKSGAYSDPWNVIDDVMLMFDNAWLYNRKASKVYKYCSKLAEVFESEVDPIMQLLGFCCGRRYVFTPQVLCCFGKQLCVIPRDSTYYNYLDRYIYCEKCFNELPGDEIEILDDPSNPGLKIKKEKFVKEKNDKLEPEPIVDCLECGRRMHKICVQHLEQIWTSGFICDPCRKVMGQKKKENKYTAKRLPPTKLGSYLENRVNSLLKRKAAGAGDVTVRVLSSYDKAVEVKPAMKARFVDSGQMSESFPYRVKAIFAFEEIDGIDVCFFGMHVQEYGSDCPASNARRVYVAYLDSVNFFQPRQFRTTVYHELLIGYMDYVKTLGYQMAHIWACPPSEGDDYIFYCHPPDMKIPKPKRLQEWYRKMLDKAICDRVIFDYKDILKDAIDNNIHSVTELPYFEGDFWPNILEENIKELNQEEMEKRQREKEEAAADTDDGEAVEGSLAELQTVAAGKKKDQKSGKTKKKNPKAKKLSSRRSKSSLTQGSSDLSVKILASMDKHKEVFFVIRLQPKPSDTELPDIKDPDPLMSNELMDGRDPLLTMARDKHLEFSSLRRAKFSSMALLYELHMQAKDNFIYTCNNCKASVETRYHCLVCEDFDLCGACFRKLQHPHRMTKLGLDLDDGGQGDSKPQNPQEARRQKIQTYVQVLEHSCICRDANCTLSSCRNMRKALAIHPKECRRKNRGVCATCKQLFTLCCYHAKGCREKRCLVPFCQNIKQNLEKQRQKERLQQQMMMRRRVALMHRAEDVAQAGPSTLEPVRTMPPLPAYSGSFVGNGKTGKSPPMLSNEAMYHSGKMQGLMHSEFASSAQQCNPVGDSGWGPTCDGGQFAPQDTFCQIAGFHGKTELAVEGIKSGISAPSGPTSIERLTGSEDKQKLVAFLKANPRLMADVIKKVRQQDAVNQQMKHQQMHMMPNSAVQSIAMMDGPIRNPVAPMTNFPMQQPGLNMGPGRQVIQPQMKMMPNGDHGNMMQQSSMLEYQQHQQQQQQQQQQMQQQQMIPQGYDGYPPGSSMMPSQPLNMGFSMPGLTMTHDYRANRMASRMPFSQPPRHIHPSLMNHQIHRQPHASLMGYSMSQEMMAGPQGLQQQQMADPSSVMCSLPSASPLSASSPRPASNCSPSPHHLPPHYMNKVLTHSADAGSGGTGGGPVPRTGSVGLQPNMSGPTQLCPDGSSMRQLSFSPSGKNLEMPNTSLSRPSELGDTMQFSVANSFSHFLDRK